MNTDEVARQVTEAFLVAEQAWQGCDWTNLCGPHGVDLHGLKAKQTQLLAEATTGEESDAWIAATRWLEQVERDAREARAAASSAVELFARRQWAAALGRIEIAWELESHYHEELVWGPLRDLIALTQDDADATS